MSQSSGFEEIMGIKVSNYHSVIIGSGAAGLNCALHLVEEGIEPDQVAIITEELGGGTSFNTGSDKQTYYKMSIIGKQKDSPYDMARDMVAGGAMHGDIALIEATNSIREFFHLIQLGVPFPHDKYGGYVGYRTDYDPKQRATSIGPLTSQKMSECLLSAIKELNIRICDTIYAFKLIVDKGEEGEKIIGVVGIDIENLLEQKDLENLLGSIRIYLARNVIIATGGPAALYKYSVYPPSQWGGLGLAIDAGCGFQNLTESQFGLASTQFRWNLSGSYQQVVPRYYSLTDKGEQSEFLGKYFPTFRQLSKAIFSKGYQWPFNSEQITDYGSSLIDLAVYHHTEIMNRKVFLDFRKNPMGFDEKSLDSSVIYYLKKSNAMAATPIERLDKLNPDAIGLYEKHGLNLWEEPLQIALCNQHLNGGIKGDEWWESNIKHLFAIGEANGSHGIHRPGGAALNSGQVGGLRTAQKIAHGYGFISASANAPNKEIILKKVINPIIEEFKLALLNDNFKETPSQILQQIRNRMAKYGSIIRPLNGLSQELQVIKNQLEHWTSNVRVESNKKIINYLRVKDAFLTHKCILSAILNYHKSNGKTRGSYLIIRDKVNSALNERYIVPPKDLNSFKYLISDKNLQNKIQTVITSQNEEEFLWEDVRPIPNELGWFEAIWNKYTQDDIFK